MLVHYAVYQICVRLPAQHELVTIFDKDDFMSSVFLQPLLRSLAGNHWGNMHQVFVQHWVMTVRIRQNADTQLYAA